MMANERESLLPPTEQWSKRAAKACDDQNQDPFDGKEGLPKKTAIVMQINALKGITEADKLFLLDIYDYLAGACQTALVLRYRSMQTDVTYGICGAVVPIIIPYAQTYKDTTVPLFGYEINVGVLLSIIACVFSLVGTLIHVYDKAKKNKEFSLRWTVIVEEGCRELGLLLGRAGDDYDIDDDKKAFKKFVVKYNAIHSVNSRSQFFGIPAASSGADKKSEKTGE